MKLLGYLLMIAGASLFAGLLAWQGLDAVTGPLLGAGWRLGIVPAYYVVPLGFAALAWQALLRQPNAVGYWRLFKLNWMCLAINWVLPVAQIGGEFVRARLLTKSGASAAESGASVVVDKTIQAATQALYALLGVALLVGHAEAESIAGTAIISALTLMATIVAFYFVQRAGLFRRLAAPMVRFAPVRGARLGLSAEALDQAVIDLYRRNGRILASTCWRFLFRLALVGEVWFGLGIVGHPIGLVEALIIESLIQAVRGAAFAVPGALGVQEGSLILIGAAVGVPADMALALSLVKRVREAMVGVAGVIAWQIEEGKFAFGGQASSGQPPSGSASSETARSSSSKGQDAA